MVVNQQAQYIYYLYFPALSCWLPTLLLLLSESFNLSLCEGDHAVRVEALGWAAWALFSCQWKECGWFTDRHAHSDNLQNSGHFKAIHACTVECAHHL